MNDEDLSRLISLQATYHKASDSLRARLLSHVALEAASHTSFHASSDSVSGSASDSACNLPGQAKAADRGPRHGVRGAWLSPRRWRAWPSWQAYAGFAGGVVLTALSMGPLMDASTHWFGSLETRLVDSHVRALSQGPLIQVASSDRHTVKPWFQGKLSYAPPVQAHVGPDCELSGARTEPLHGEATAVLVYTCHRHVLSLFIWPHAQQQMPASSQIRGFHVQRWSDGAMQYWLVSDMDMQAVEQFGQAWRNPVAVVSPASGAP